MDRLVVIRLAVDGLACCDTACCGWKGQLLFGWRCLERLVVIRLVEVLQASSDQTVGGWDSCDSFMRIPNFVQPCQMHGGHLCFQIMMFFMSLLLKFTQRLHSVFCLVFHVKPKSGPHCPKYVCMVIQNIIINEGLSGNVERKTIF